MSILLGMLLGLFNYRNLWPSHAIMFFNSGNYNAIEILKNVNLIKKVDIKEYNIFY